jgi:hypothetical protein
MNIENGKCKDCRYWESDEPDRGSCQKVLIPGSLAWVFTDYEPAVGELITSPEFGCVEFERKDCEPTS